MSRYYVSVTGLRLKRWWYAPIFWRHAMPSFRQAQIADGLIFAEARKVNGVHHTLTVWQDQAAMKRFLYRGAHRKAIRDFSAIADGKTCGFENEQIPTWAEALYRWQHMGRAYEGRTTGSHSPMSVKPGG